MSVYDFHGDNFPRIPSFSLPFLGRINERTALWHGCLGHRKAVWHSDHQHQDAKQVFEMGIAIWSGRPACPGRILATKRHFSVIDNDLRVVSVAKRNLPDGHRSSKPQKRLHFRSSGSICGCKCTVVRNYRPPDMAFQVHCPSREPFPYAMKQVSINRHSTHLMKGRVKKKKGPLPTPGRPAADQRIVRRFVGNSHRH